MIAQVQAAERARAARSPEERAHEKWHMIFGDDCRRGPACPMYRKETKQ